MGLRRWTSFTQLLISASNQPQLVSSLSRTPLVLGRALGDFGLTRLTTARTREKPPPSPIQYSLRYSAAPTSEWHFFPGLPRRSPEIVPIWTPGILVVHNSLLKPSIEMRSEASLQLSLRASNGVSHFACTHQGRVGSGRFPIFSGRESNCQFDSQPFFCT